MKRLIILFSIFILASFSWLYAQSNLDFAYQTLEERGEFYFQFECSSPEVINELNDILSIDGRDGTTFYAYAGDESAFEQFLSYDLIFQPVESYYDKSKALTMATTVAQMDNWDRYPTHDVYEQMMSDFATNYPDICTLETIGQSVNGKNLLAVRISDNVNTDEDEPEYFWSNTMHGDELTSYVLSLHFIDYLLSNYGTDIQVTLLVNEIEIYVNPLANPDGTFNGSANYDDVSGSIRYNANDIDLNRNFPDQDNGQHPDGNPTAQETQIMIDYANLHDFVMSANTHAGAELINYPWDNWTTAENAHADDTWWQYVSWIYADNAQNNSPAGYFTDEGGVTEGADWYAITGSRQDYMNYFQQCRETTIELSTIKQLDVAELPNHWDYNKQAMLDYTEQVLYGFRGIVTDTCTGILLDGVRVEISGHDKDSSHVYSSASVGNYHRPIYEGTWDATFSKSGYQSKTISVTVANDDSTRLDVQLVPENVGVPDYTADQTSVFEGETVNFTDLSTGTITAYNWTLTGGTPNSSIDTNPSVVYNTAGIYDVILEITSEGCNISELKENYITVLEAVPPVASFSASPTTSCDGIIQFTDESISPESWYWDFGDGDTSILQNPEHTYIADGTYTVTLSVSNAYGTDDTIRTDYITIDMPNEPVVTDAENCGPDTLTLSASASGELNWYDSQTGGNLLATGTNYTDNFTTTTTVYVDNTIVNSQNYTAGKVDNSGDGGYFTYTNQHGLIFDAYTDLVIESVKVYADGAGDRTITLLDNTDTEIASTTVTIPNGESYINLNFNVPEGTGYTLMGPGSPNLYRNGGGGVVLPYPYETTGVLSIHNNTADNLEYYYYFYDWQVRVDETCISPRVPDIANIYDLPTVDLGADQKICEGDNYTFDAGSGFTSYLWNTGEISQSIVADTAGTYSVEVTDANGCNATDNVNLTVNPVPVLSFSSTQENGNNGDGTATVTVTAGDYPTLIYNWSNDSTTATIENLSAGYYCVTVTNGYGCTAAGCHTVTSTEPVPIADFEADVTEGCGSLTVQFTDLTANDPTNWSWDFGDGDTSSNQNPQHTYAAPGTYTVILSATNAIGTDDEQKTGYITVYNTLEVSDGIGNVTCYGDTDGSLTAIVNGGEGTYIYHWENGSGVYAGNTETINGLAPGTYYLTVSDAAGCSDNGVYTVVEPDAMQVNIITNNESSTGACDGSATAIVIGGEEPYVQYMWLTGQTGQTVTALCEGTHEVTVTDSYGCTATGNGYVASGPQPPVSEFIADVTSGCGVITVQFIDLSSNGPTNWSWDFGDGNTSSDQNPQHTYAAPGTYTVILSATNAIGTDDEQKTGYITVYNTLEVSDGIGNVTCYGDTDGSLTAVVNGGEGTYIYHWENGSGDLVGSTESISGLAGGNYYLTITDEIGCEDSGVYIVEEPAELTLTVETTNETVEGACDGIATAQVSGGTPDYTYQWNLPEPHTQTENDLWAGTFCVTATDAHGCTVSDCGTVEQGPSPPPAEFEADITEGCESMTVQFTALHPDSVISWSWNFGDGSISAEQNPQHIYEEAGTYTVELTVEHLTTGADTESITDYIIVLEHPELDIDVTHETTTGSCDGEITVIITGNDDPYSILWNTGDVTETIDSLCIGLYSVAVTGSNGCSNTANGAVETITLLESQNENGIALYPNPANYMLYIESDEPVQRIDVYSVDGRLVDSWNPKSKTFEMPVEYMNGLYMIRITDNTGAVSNHQIIVKK